LAGSYYLEHLTDEIQRQAEVYIDRIDEMGGALKAVELGYFQREIQESAYRYQRQVEEGERTVVGVNKYIAAAEEEPENLLRVDRTVQKQQIEFLQKVKDGRDQKAVGRALKDLAAAARGDENLMPALLECVQKYASLGEICDVLREVFGEYREQAVV
jgi:methylmalonyl-CoA mutase N-terminal domain/subunit